VGTKFLNIADVFRKNRPSKWGLDYYSPWEFNPDGTNKRKKEFFATKDLRADRRIELEQKFAKFGASATDLPSSDELSDYRASRAVLPPAVSTAKAAKFYLAHHLASGMKLPELFAAYEASMKARGLDPAWIKQVKGTLDRFAAFMPEGTGVGDVTKDDGRRWMASLEPRPAADGKPARVGYSVESRNNFRRRVHGAFEWAVEEELRESNPFARVEVPRVRRGAPAYFTVAEARAILAATALWYPDYVRFVVLRFFVGMRRSQIRRLQPADIDVKRRKIDAPGWREIETKDGRKKTQRVTKSGKRHLIQHAPEVVWDWLERYPTLNTANHLQKFRKIFKRAGVVPKKNAFRHTFATYHVNLHGNANQTMHILGQEEDSKAFFDSYAGVAHKEESEEFFALYLAAVLPGFSRNQKTETDAPELSVFPP
jgi:integrase